jgi:hypothetical protein
MALRLFKRGLEFDGDYLCFWVDTYKYTLNPKCVYWINEMGLKGRGHESIETSGHQGVGAPNMRCQGDAGLGSHDTRSCGSIGPEGVKYSELGEVRQSSS